MCIILSAIELIIFVIIAALAARASTPPEAAITTAAFATAFLPQFGNFIVAVATTWYVAFTYDILRATDTAMRVQAQPFLRVFWSMDTDVASKSAPELSKLNDQVRELLAQSGFTISPTATPTRYVTISLQNQRVSRIGIISFSWRAELLKPEVGMTLLAGPVSGDVRLDGLDIGQSQSLRVTLIDTSSIPLNQRIRITLNMIQYIGADSTTILSEFVGEASFEVPGALPPSSVVNQDNAIIPEVKVSK
jgi:uncharacterized membrane protein YfbV (UPF0208 family)